MREMYHKDGKATIMNAQISHPTVAARGDTVHLLGTLVSFKALASDTEGAFSLVEAMTAPGQGTPPHLQRDDAEAFYVLEGEFEFMLDGKTALSGPGAFHYVPRGVA